jgi:hypothetical protein
VLLYGAVLSLPAEFLSAAEPPAEVLLHKLQRVEMPATRPLSDTEVAAKPPATLLQSSHVYVLRGKLLYGAALSLPAEFLSAAEPPAEELLHQLQRVEMPATRPLSNT